MRAPVKYTHIDVDDVDIDIVQTEVHGSLRNYFIV